MKQNKTIRGSKWSAIVILTLVIVLSGLTAATIVMIITGSSVKTSVPFDLEEITADYNTENSDASELLIPEIIGITENGSGYASSLSAVTTSELYRTVLPAVSEVLASNGTADSSENLWNSFIERNCSVYIRFHHEIPNYLICSLAGIEETPDVTMPVYEMFLLPYSANSDSVTAAVRSLDGTITVYTKKAPENIITEDELSKLLGSYTSALNLIEFTDSGEPVFTDSLLSRDIIITDGTASMVNGNTDASNSLMRLFSMNPDKLLNTHISRDGTGSYIAHNGILRISRSSFTYTASQDGGVPVENYVKSQPQPTLNDCISAAYTIFESIEKINRHFTGGDADIMLSAVSSSGSRVTVVFEYVIDNIRIIDTDPAVTAVFDNGRLTDFSIYTLSVRSLGTRSPSISKKWFSGYLEKLSAENVRGISLVYRADFISESVKAQWCGEEYTGKEN